MAILIKSLFLHSHMLRLRITMTTGGSSFLEINPYSDPPTKLFSSCDDKKNFSHVLSFT